MKGVHRHNHFSLVTGKFELVAERGEAQQDLTPLFAELRNDNPQRNDGVFDIDNMPLTEEPECVINDLNLYSKNSKI